jgi:hypothetical protein
MKRRVSVVFVVLVLMAIFVSTVFAAPAQTGKSITFVSIKYQPAGVVLMFQTSGLTENDLKDPSFFAHSSDQNIYCAFVRDTTDVRCVLSKKLAQYQGESFHGTLAGISFDGKFPNNTYCTDGEITWYSITEYFNGEFYFAGEAPAWAWNEYAAMGGFEMAATYGYTYEITGSFCGSNDYGFS